MSMQPAPDGKLLRQFSPMEITEHCVVALTWVLQDTLGEELDVLDEPVEFLVGGDDLLARLEQALQGHGTGAELALHLEPEEAFGEYDENLLFLEPRTALPAELQEGMIIEDSSLPTEMSARLPKDHLFTVAQIYPDHIVLDGNHPLAGMALRLTLKVHGVRAATPQETERRSAGTSFFKLQG